MYVHPGRVQGTTKFLRLFLSMFQVNFEFLEVLGGREL